MDLGWAVLVLVADCLGGSQRLLGASSIVEMALLACSDRSRMDAVQLQWDRFIEWGRVHRHRLATAALIDYAREVDRNWDQIVAGNSTLVSPYFNAYPLDKPTLLLLATEQPIPQTSHRVIAIERSGDRTIRFELSRGDRGYWLEVRQASAGQPQSYVGGLEEQQNLVGWRSLGEQAFLVRYAMD